MRKYLTIVVAGLAILAGAGVWMQSQTLQFGAFSWTHIGLFPFSSKTLHVVKYGDETLCGRVLEATESPWVRANADRTLSVSCGRVGSETTVHYSIDTKDYVSAPRYDMCGFDLSFDTLAQRSGDTSFAYEVSVFRNRMAAWNRS